MDDEEGRRDGKLREMTSSGERVSGRIMERWRREGDEEGGRR